MIERAEQFTATRGDGAGPNPSRWTLFKREVESGTMDDYRYTSVRDHGLPLMRAAVEGLSRLAEARRDRVSDLVAPSGTDCGPGVSAAATPGAILGAMGLGGTNIANLTGFPDLIVPAGFTGDRLPVAISFFGAAFSEPRLLALGYSFEQATMRAGCRFIPRRSLGRTRNTKARMPRKLRG